MGWDEIAAWGAKVGKFQRDCDREQAYEKAKKIRARNKQIEIEQKALDEAENITHNSAYNKR